MANNGDDFFNNVLSKVEGGLRGALGGWLSKESTGTVALKFGKNYAEKIAREYGLEHLDSKAQAAAAALISERAEQWIKTNVSPTGQITMSTSSMLSYERRTSDFVNDVVKIIEDELGVRLSADEILRLKKNLAVTDASGIKDVEDKLESLGEQPPECFPANTLISLSSGETTPISSIVRGDVVLAFDPEADLSRSHKFAKRMGFQFIGGSYVFQTM